MTKKELLEALEPYGDDQYVYVRLHSREFPCGSQVMVQSVWAQPPWCGAKEDKSNYLIGLNAHDQNRILAPGTP